MRGCQIQLGRNVFVDLCEVIFSASILCGRGKNRKIKIDEERTVCMLKHTQKVIQIGDLAVM